MSGVETLVRGDHFEVMKKTDSLRDRILVELGFSTSRKDMDEMVGHPDRIGWEIGRALAGHLRDRGFSPPRRAGQGVHAQLLANVRQQGPHIA